MKSEIARMSAVLRGLRQTLYDRDFVEVPTPVARKADCGFRPRPSVELGERKFLREAVGPALRMNLEYHPRVFDLGPCFRYDAPDSSHSPEFLMLDLYAAGEDMGFLIGLVRALVEPVLDRELEVVSVAAHIHQAVGVDPAVAEEEEVRVALVRHLHLAGFTTMYAAVERLFERDLEPLSSGRAILFADLPLGTEVCARRKEGTSAVLNRFELFVDGLEVVHGYEDEVDNDEFVQRASEILFLNSEQQAVQDSILAGGVPARSVGMGIGIERLCALASGGGSSVADFRFSPGF